MDINNLLFPTDFSISSEKALDHAIILAHRFNAKLMILHVEIPYATDPNNPKKEFPKFNELFDFIKIQTAKCLDKTSIPVIKGDIEITNHVIRGLSSPSEILQFSQEQNADMIIMGSHGRGGMGHFLLGSTTERVIHNATIPVMTIHHGEDLLLKNDGSYKRILVPIDFSSSSHKTLKYAINFANIFGSEIILTHVIEPINSHQALIAGTKSSQKFDNDTLNRSKQALDTFAGDLIDDKTKFILSSGKIHHEIIKVCEEENIDLLILANHGWNAIDRLLLGGTTEKLVRKAKIPVLVVR